MAPAKIHDVIFYCVILVAAAPTPIGEELKKRNK
jgi:hypothetical protein